MNPRAIAASTMATCLALATPVVAYYEGMVPQTYADPVGIPTICYGHTGADVAKGRTATPAECEALLRNDLAAAVADVNRCIVRELQPHQAAALVSFAYNAGGANLCSSTLARMVNTGAPAAMWCAQLDRWIYARGVRLPGLVKRRAAERALCEGRAAA